MKRPKKRESMSKTQACHASVEQEKSGSWKSPREDQTKDALNSNKITTRMELGSRRGSFLSKRLDARTYRQAMSSRYKSIQGGMKASEATCSVKANSLSLSMGTEECESDPMKGVEQEHKKALEESPTSNVVLTCSEERECNVPMDPNKNVTTDSAQSIEINSEKETSVSSAQNQGKQFKKFQDDTVKETEPSNQSDNLDKKKNDDKPMEKLRRSSRISASIDLKCISEKAVGETRSKKKMPCKVPEDVDVKEKLDTCSSSISSSREHTTLQDTLNTPNSSASRSLDGAPLDSASADLREKSNIMGERKCMSPDSPVKLDEKKVHVLDQSEKYAVQSVLLVDKNSDENNETCYRASVDEWLQCMTCRKWQRLESVQLPIVTWTCNDESCRTVNFLCQDYQEEGTQPQSSDPLSEEKEASDACHESAQKKFEPVVENLPRSSDCLMQKEYVTEEAVDAYLESKEGFVFGSLVTSVHLQCNIQIQSPGRLEKEDNAMILPMDVEETDIMVTVGQDLFTEVETDPKESKENTIQPCHTAKQDNMKEVVTEPKNKIELGNCILETRGVAEQYVVQIGTNEERIPTDSYNSVCQVCREGGELLCCDGKDCVRTYHIGCLVPPFAEVPPAEWYCPSCTYKRMSLDLYTVCKGIESVWDVMGMESDVFVLQSSKKQRCSNPAKQLPKPDSTPIRSADIEAQYSYTEKITENDFAGTVTDKLLPEKGSCQNEKLYLVKYKGLSHLHNRWISESELSKEAPKLLASFKRNAELGKVHKWNSDWVKPVRFIQKRPLVIEKPVDGDCASSSENISCKVEWFVKWSGLDYNNCTWELETTLLQKTSCNTLIEEYEERHTKAHQRSKDWQAVKGKIAQKGTYSNVGNTEGGWSGGIDSIHLKKLTEFWQNGKHAVIIDEFGKELVSLIVSLIIYLIKEVGVCRPILIATANSAMDFWEVEFSAKAPFIDMISYRGKRAARDIIRKCEFFSESRNVLPQIVLSTLDIVSVDIDFLKHLEWEAVIIDLCQRYKLSKKCDSLKQLTADFRLLLVNEHLKDTIAELHSLLAFLDCNSECQDIVIDKQHATFELVSEIKNKLSEYIVYERKPAAMSSVNFQEYWVAVDLTSVQTEQYCNILIRNKEFLCCMLRRDDCGALRNILISLRKVCDHPYLLDSSIQIMLQKNKSAREFLEIDIKASSKLQLIDYVLSEHHQQGKRALILFQIVGGSQRMTLGDILDDFVRQRFGVDAYERVDGVLSSTKKQSSSQRFNSKDGGRFVFLLEKRVCGASIKLSSIDTVIIFNSDWNPISDLRALQKIHIDNDNFKILRLYCQSTVEENVIMSAGKDTLSDTILESMNSSSCQALLKGKVNKLFEKYDIIDGRETSSSELELKSLAKDLTLVCIQGESNSLMANNSVQRVFLTDDCEKYVDTPEGFENKTSEVDIPPIFFWEKLLDGRRIKRQYVTEQLQRPRRKVSYCDRVSPKSGHDSGEPEPRKKRRKVNGTINPISLSPRLGLKKINDNTVKSGSGSHTSTDQTSCQQENTMETNASLNMGKENPSCGIVDMYNSDSVMVDRNPLKVKDTSGQSHSIEESMIQKPCFQSSALLNQSLEENRSCVAIVNEQHGFPGYSKLESGDMDVFDLKQNLGKVRKILQLPDPIQILAEKYLENAAVSSKFAKSSPVIIHAFIIALCLVAAEGLKYNLDLEISVVLARAYLNFQCQKEDVNPWLLELREQYLNKNTNLHSESNLCPGVVNPAPGSSMGEEIAKVQVEIDNFKSASEKSQGLHDSSLSVPASADAAQCMSNDMIQNEKTINANGCNLASGDVSKLEASTINNCERQFETVGNDGSNLLDRNLENGEQAAIGDTGDFLRCQSDTDSDSQMISLSAEDIKRMKDKIHLLKQARLKQQQVEVSETYKRLAKEDKRADNRDSIPNMDKCNAVTKDRHSECFKKVVEDLKQRQFEIREKENRLYNECLRQINDGKISKTLFDIIEPESIPENSCSDAGDACKGSEIIADSESNAQEIVSGSASGKITVNAVSQNAVGASSSAIPIILELQRSQQVASESVDSPPRETVRPEILESLETSQQIASKSADFPPRETGTTYASCIPPTSSEQIKSASISHNSHELNYAHPVVTSVVTMGTVQPVQVTDVDHLQHGCQNNQMNIVQHLEIQHGQTTSVRNLPAPASSAEPVFPIQYGDCGRGINGLREPFADASVSERVNEPPPSLQWGASYQLPGQNIAFVPTRSAHVKTCDPLKQESLKIQKEQERIKKLYDDEVMQTNYQFEKELEDLKRRYEQAKKEKERAFLQRKKGLEENLAKVEKHRLLAELIKMKSDVQLSIESGYLQLQRCSARMHQSTIIQQSGLHGNPMDVPSSSSLPFSQQQSANISYSPSQNNQFNDSRQPVVLHSSQRLTLAAKSRNLKIGQGVGHSSPRTFASSIQNRNIEPSGPSRLLVESSNSRESNFSQGQENIEGRQNTCLGVSHGSQQSSLHDNPELLGCPNINSWELNTSLTDLNDIQLNILSNSCSDTQSLPHLSCSALGAETGRTIQQGSLITAEHLLIRNQRSMATPNTHNMLPSPVSALSTPTMDSAVFADGSVNATQTTTQENVLTNSGVETLLSYGNNAINLVTRNCSLVTRELGTAQASHVAAAQANCDGVENSRSTASIIYLSDDD